MAATVLWLSSACMSTYGGVAPIAVGSIRIAVGVPFELATVGLALLWDNHAPFLRLWRFSTPWIGGGGDRSREMALLSFPCRVST